MSDPRKQELKAAKKDAARRAQSSDRDTSEQGSADWHKAADALRARRRRS